MRRPMQTIDDSLDDHARGKLEVTDPREYDGIDEASGSGGLERSHVGRGQRLERRGLHP